MAYRFKARSTTPGQYRLAAGTLAQLVALSNIVSGVNRGDGGIGTYTDGGEALVTPTLAVADQADGTGATATITTSDTAATNAVWVYQVDGELGAGTWTSEASRTGDGTVDLTLGVGLWWAKCVSTKSSQTAASNLVYFRVTSGSTAMQVQCINAVQARIRLLALTSIPDAQVITREVPTPDRNVTLPSVQVCPGVQEKIDPSAGTTHRDDVGYPVTVYLMAAQNQDATIAARNLLWRERIIGAFRSQPLGTVDGVHICNIEPGPIATGFYANLWLSSLTIRCIARQTRGL